MILDNIYPGRAEDKKYLRFRAISRAKNVADAYERTAYYRKYPCGLHCLRLILKLNQTVKKDGKACLNGDARDYPGKNTCLNWYAGDKNRINAG